MLTIEFIRDFHNKCSNKRTYISCFGCPFNFTDGDIEEVGYCLEHEYKKATKEKHKQMYNKYIEWRLLK